MLLVSRKSSSWVSLISESLLSSSNSWSMLAVSLQSFGSFFWSFSDTILYFMIHLRFCLIYKKKKNLHEFQMQKLKTHKDYYLQQFHIWIIIYLSNFSQNDYDSLDDLSQIISYKRLSLESFISAFWLFLLAYPKVRQIWESR